MRKAPVCVFLLVLCAVARAEVNIVDSLEWMAVDASLVVRGKVVRGEDSKGTGAAIYCDVTIDVEETIKGKLRDKLVKVRLWLLGDDGSVMTWKSSGHSFLFFLRRGQADDDKALVGHWVPRESRQSVIDLEKPQKVYLAERKRPKDAEEILRLVRKYSAQKPPPQLIGEPNIFKPQLGYLRLQIERDSEIFPELFMGSSCYINVPAEEKYRSLALTKARSKDYYERADGADMLRNFPGEKTIKLLIDLMDDPAEVKWTNGAGELSQITYPVRKAAYEALLTLGEKPTKPVFRRDPTDDEKRKAREGQKK